LRSQEPPDFLINKQTIELIKEIEIAGIPAILKKQGFGTFVLDTRAAAALI